MNNTIKKIMLLASSSILGGCFDTPSSPASPPDTKTPLKQEKTLSPVFTIPEGVTKIRSAFSEANTPDWGNAQNWTSDFYKDGESIGCDLSHQFVPCRSTMSSIPTQITIHTGTCFVNESVELSGLEMSDNTRMTIPEGVTVTNRGDLQTNGVNGVTIDGGGDFYVSGRPSLFCIGNAKLNAFHAPKVSWGGQKASFEVKQAALQTLIADKIHVKDQLRVSDISLHDRIDLAVNQLHITKSEKEYARLNLFKIARPLNIGRLSFDSGTIIKIRQAAEHRDGMDVAQWQPIRLTGTLDVTNMNIFNTLELSNWGEIGEKIPILIAEKGINGDLSFLRKHRRIVVSGYWGDSKAREKEGFFSTCSSNLVWVEGNSVYWQRMSGPLANSADFLVYGDAELNQLRRDNLNNIVTDFVQVSPVEWRQMLQICNALVEQKKAIYENATEAGIERYLAVQTTPNAKDRVLKLLELVNIKPYLNERDELSEHGVQLVVDSLSHLGTSLTRELYGLQVMNRPNNTPNSRTYGIAFGGTNYSVSGAFHQNYGTAPWVMGAEYRTKLQADVWGILRTIGEGVEGHPFTLHANCGMVYALSPVSQFAVFAGSRSLLGSALTGSDRGDVLPLSAVWSLEAGVEWSTRLGAHELRVGGEVSYRPEQSTSVRITDLAVTLDNISVMSGWNVTGSVGYAYKHEDGIQWFGNMSVKIGDNKSIFGTVGVTLER